MEKGIQYLPAPVVDGFLVVDLSSQSVDQLGRSPQDALEPSSQRESPYLLLLLLQALVENRHHKVLKQAVVLVRNEEVSSSVDALQTEIYSSRMPTGWTIKYLFPWGWSHRCRKEPCTWWYPLQYHLQWWRCNRPRPWAEGSGTYKLVLSEVTDDFSLTAGDLIGSVGKEDGAAGVLADLRSQPVLVLVGKRLLVAQSPIQLRNN